MKISSFDIFDTCLVRKCGTPENLLDVLSLRVFNQQPPEWARQEFVAARRAADHKVWAENPYCTLSDIYAELDWEHQFLKPKAELYKIEHDLEREMLVPVLAMRDKVESCRKRGDKIIYISDMYLSSEFLISILKECGFYKDGDSLYVSCECGATKVDGALFEYVRKAEGLSSFRKWHHYGDNKVGDYNVPRKLGINCTLVNHKYTPYQQQWKDNDYSLGYKYPSILAGVSRSLHYSTEWNTHTDFVLDIIAPFYCSWMYQVLEDASKKGIKRLYFCARDAYQIHKIALQIQPLFPNVGIEYVYMSRVALYKEDNDAAKIAYFERIGLATKTDKVAIVDTTTSGKTLVYLNQYLSDHSYNEITSYYYLLWNKVEGVERNKYNVQVYDAYIYNNPQQSRLLSHLFIFENYFGLSKDKKTIDYKFNNDVAVPVFSTELKKEDCVFVDDVDWAEVHSQLLSRYAAGFVSLGLGQWAKDIFANIGSKNVSSFFAVPLKSYACALETYSYYDDVSGVLYPIVKRIYNPIELISKNRRYYWRRGCIYLTIPNWIIDLYKYLKS